MILSRGIISVSELGNARLRGGAEHSMMCDHNRQDYNLWQAETGGRTEWITWLYNVKGYPNNPAFLKQLGIQ